MKAYVLLSVVFSLSICASQLNQGGIFFDVIGKISLDGGPAPRGTVVEAYSESGVLCGRIKVRIPGYLGIMHVYADDSATPLVDGVKKGEAVHFTHAGKRLESSKTVFFEKPYENAEIFLYYGVKDISPPVIKGVERGQQTMRIVFSEPVNHLLLKDRNNYSPCAAIEKIIPGKALSSAKIFFSGPLPDVLVISRLEDLFGNSVSDALIK